MVLAFLIALEIILTKILLDPDTDRADRIRISAGRYDGDFIRTALGRNRICYRRCAGHADLPISSLLPGIYPDGIFDRNDIRVFPQGKEITWKSVLPASLLVILGCNLYLDTLWLSILMGDGYLALLPARILKCVLMLPIHLILIPFVWNRIVSKIPFAGQMTA